MKIVNFRWFFTNLNYDHLTLDIDSSVLMCIAYNFMSLFKQVAIGGEVRQRLKTLRYRMLAIPAIVERKPDKTIVRMALQMKRRCWINKICNSLNEYP